jgi:hypothetical protein
MSDAEKIAPLLQIAGDPARLVAAQHTAAARLLAYDGEIFPQDACAITQSVLMQQAGIDVQDTYGALDMVRLLRDERGWTVVTNGEEQPGDIGTTCGPKPHHGVDHVYLVLKVLNADEMVIADNQAEMPHFRYISGFGGKSPTQFFLRAG